MSSMTIAPRCENNHGAATVADFAVARVAGISAACLDGFVFRETIRHLEEVLACEAELAKAIPALEVVLFRLVPQLDHDRDMRRRVLALKRCIHNRRVSPSTAQDVKSIGTILSGEEQFQLSHWYQLATGRESAMAAAASAYEQQVADASRILQQNMMSSFMQHGLAIASPDLLSDVLRGSQQEDRDWLPCSKRARSSLAYLSRAAMKTSPLSNFTQISVANIGSGDRKLISKSGKASSAQEYPVRLLRALPHDWLMLAARNPELSPAFRYEANAGIRPNRKQRGKFKILKPFNQFTGPHFWRGEVIGEVHLDEPLQAILTPGRRFDYSELAGLAQSAKAPSAHGFILSLLDQMLIRPVAPYSRKDFRPLLALADVLSNITTDYAAGISQLMRQLQSSVDSAGAASGPERLQVIWEVRRLATAIYAALGAQPPKWITTMKPLVENVALDSSEINLPVRIQHDLACAAEKFRQRTIRTKMYDYLYQYFVRTFGEEGETDDILGFLFDFLAREDFPELLSRSIAEDKLTIQEADNDRSSLPGGASAIPPTLTIFFQLAAADRDALDHGEYYLVINQVNSGEGGLLGRFANIGGTGQNLLRDKLADWVNHLYGGLNPLELLTCADVNSLQTEQGTCTGVFEWPGELPVADSTGGPAVRLDQLRLRANQNGTLYFVDEHGEPVCLSYQGVVPSYLAPPALRLLMVIADPWVRDYGMEKATVSSGEQGTAGIQYFPRRQDGRIVFQRAKWHVPASALVRKENGESDFSFFVRVNRWRIEHGLPEEVFVQAERTPISAQAKDRKPFWVNFGSPHSIEVLHQLAGADTDITLTEALPARIQHWVMPHPEHPRSDKRASEFMSLVRWPMPEPPAANRQRKTVSIVTPSAANDWLYFKIYPKYPGQLDHVIREIVRPAVQQARASSELSRWFFIRYIDQRGWHIRLRLQGSQTARERWRDELSQLIESRLPSLTACQTAERLFIPARHEVCAQPAELGYTLANYEPEFEKYGGAAGLHIAEDFFEVSSEVALRALECVSTSAGYISLVLTLARNLVRQTQSSPSGCEYFLHNYLWYWSGQDRPGADQLRCRVREAAARRRKFVAECISSVQAHPVLSGLLSRLERATQLTVSNLQHFRHEVTASPARLAFDYLHMNNNRFGVLPGEEAYVAALLLTDCGYQVER